MHQQDESLFESLEQGEEENKEKRLRNGLKFSGNRFHGEINLNLKFLVQIIINMHRWVQDRGSECYGLGLHFSQWSLRSYSNWLNHECRKYHHILIHHAIPSEKHMIVNGFIFQHNNVPKHTAMQKKHTWVWKETQNIHTQF